MALLTSLAVVSEIALVRVAATSETSDERPDATPDRTLERILVAVAPVASVPVGAVVIAADSVPLVTIGMGRMTVSEELALELIKLWLSEADETEESGVLEPVTVGSEAELVTPAEDWASEETLSVGVAVPSEVGVALKDLSSELKDNPDALDATSEAVAKTVEEVPAKKEERPTRIPPVELD